MFKSASRVISTVPDFFSRWYHQEFGTHFAVFFMAGLALAILGGIDEVVHLLVRWINGV